MNIGKLRHRVEIIKEVMTQDPMTGAIDYTEQVIDTTWAHIIPLSAREFIASSATQSELVAKCVIRYRNDIDETCKIKDISKNICYNITGILADNKSGIEYQTLMLITEQ